MGLLRKFIAGVLLCFTINLVAQNGVATKVTLPANGVATAVIMADKEIANFGLLAVGLVYDLKGSYFQNSYYASTTGQRLGLFLGYSPLSFSSDKFVYRLTIANEFLRRTYSPIDASTGLRDVRGKGFTLNSYVSNSLGVKAGKLTIFLDTGFGNFFKMNGGFSSSQINYYRGISLRLDLRKQVLTAIID